VTIKSVFDIIGPVMIGPSSSHTAGAARIGRMARSILGEEPKSAQIYLYGSFAKTYKGHGTDRALIGGLMGMDADDSNIKTAPELAAKHGLDVEIRTGTGLEGTHPNTVHIYLTGVSGRKVFVGGSSVGGGNVLVSRINDFDVAVQGRYPTLLVEHTDIPGMVGRITTILGGSGINIAEMRTARNEKGAGAFTVIQTDQPVTEKVVTGIAGLPDIITVSKILPFREVI